MTNLPDHPQSGFEVEPIAINAAGVAHMDTSRDKESIIRSERLDATHPLVEVDLEKIITQDEGCGISIVVQDFGLPPRTINIRGDFPTMREVAGLDREDSHYQGAPKVLIFESKNPDFDKTFYLDEKDLPDSSEAVELKRGQSMVWVHDGSPSDERTGYIEDNGSGWGLVARRAYDYYGKPDFSDIDELHNRRYYTNFIGITYIDNVLSIYSLDDVHAEVQYQQVRGLEDVVPTFEAEADELDEEGLIAEILAGNGESLKAIISERKEALSKVRELGTTVIETAQMADNLETLLSGNKRKLSDARQEAAKWQREAEKLRREAGVPKDTKSKESDFLYDLLGGRASTEADPHGHCAQIGLDASFLFSLDPDAAQRVVKGIHKGLAMQFHSDRSDGPKDDEPMKRVNGAVDSILNRLEQGYWGRH